MARYENFSVGNLTVSKIYSSTGTDITPGANPYGGFDYYVDGNTTNGIKDGSNWDCAFDTLTKAITASNASMALASNRIWARRNRIFVCGDQEIEEDLTILPEKCDVIGCGNDACGAFPMILGNHTIAATRPTASKANACRFINIGFQDTDGTADVFVAPAGCTGLSFIDCTFLPLATGSAGKALKLTDCASVRIINCDWPLRGGSTAGIFAEAISIEGTTSIHDIRIAHCRIYATQGIAIANGATDGSWIHDNYIYATGLTIKDSSGTCLIVNNRLISAASATITGAGVITSADGMGAGNKLTCGDDHNAEYPLEDVLDG
ncbi:MAG: hypothetical protein WC373_12560 [Smithella sp.]